MILLNAKARGRCWRGDLFSNMMPSLVCHGYCLTAHMHSMEWFVGSEHGRGGVSMT